MSATTDAPTVCSLSNHTYWNLGGPTESTIDDHVVTIDASTLVPVGEDLIPDGEPVDAEGPFDLRAGGVLGGRIDFRFPPVMTTASWSTAPGFDATPGSITQRPGGGSRCGRISRPASSTRGFLPGTEGGGRTHGVRCARPRTPTCRRRTQPAVAPSPVVRPGEPYRHHLEFRLTTDASEAS